MDVLLFSIVLGAVGLSPEVVGDAISVSAG